MGIWPGHIWPYIYILCLISSRAQKVNTNFKKVPESPKSLDDKASGAIPVFTNTVYSNALNAKLSNWCGSTVHIINSADTLICSLRRHFCLIDPNPSSEMYYISFVLPMAVVPNLFFHVLFNIKLNIYRTCFIEENYITIIIVIVLSPRPTSKYICSHAPAVNSGGGPLAHGIKRTDIQRVFSIISDTVNMNPQDI